MQGLMQLTQLTMPHMFERAERYFPEKEIVTATPLGRQRATYGEWAARARRLGGVLDQLGISGDGRVGSFAWNTQRHLELWFAVPCSGRVLHTLNIRLFPEQLTYIVNHAEDEVIFVDLSLMGLLGPLLPTFSTVKHLVVMNDTGGEVPAVDADIQVHDYEELLAAASPVQWHVEDENQAASMCYTSGTSGNPNHLNVLAASPSAVILVGKQPGATYFTALNAKNEVIMQRHVLVAAPKERYVRIRKTCAGTGDKNCQPTQVYYCPDTCHQIMIGSEGGKDSGEAAAPAEDEAKDATQQAAQSGQKNETAEQ